MRESFWQRMRPGRAIAGLAILTLSLSLTQTYAASRGVVSADSDRGQVSGTAAVVDGDTLDIGGLRVRIEGIDAPESAQSCPRHGRSSATWECGRAATRALSRLVSGRIVSCTPVEADDYGRLIAHCRAGGLDLASKMIDGGWAWAFVKYNARFKSRERAARHRGEGMWRLGAGIPPWEFRANGWRLAAQQAPRAECPIKGNISGAGRIYHMPWSRWYSRTHVEAARGERWFCTEAAARAAGWRPASRT